MFVREIPVNNQLKSKIFRLGLQVYTTDSQVKISKNQNVPEQMFLSVLDDRGQQTINDYWRSQNKDTWIDCSRWPNGSYYMSIRDEERKLVKMFEIQKR